MPRAILRLSLCICVLLAPACRDAKVESTCGGTQVRLATSGKLTVAADYSYPPFAFRSPRNDLVGFEVELARHIAKQMRLEPFFVNRGSGALVTGLLSHRHDLALSGLRPTKTLQEETCVSMPFLEADLGVLIPSTAVESVDAVRDLKGKTVAVLDGSEAERYALDELDGSTIASLSTIDDLLTSVQQGKADAAVADLPFVRFSAQQSKAFAVAATIGTGDGYVAIGGKDNGPLMQGVNDAIERLVKAGTIMKLKQKFFGG